MLGIDLVQLSEFETQLRNGGDTFIAKAFHADEIQRPGSEHLAGLWAAKEAVMKAAGAAAGRWLDIRISRSDGRPSAQFDGQEFEVAISHHGDYAVAVAYAAHPSNGVIS